MENHGNLIAFVRTADLGSFAAAGRVLGLSASAVGKAVARLEAHVGVRLFHRSTRNIRLTEEGALFHGRCRRILEDLDEAKALLAHGRDEPRGRLRVSTPIVTYHLLMPVLPEFILSHAQIELDLDFNDHLVDLIDENVDVAIRSGDLPDSRMMSRRLCQFQMVLCAAPAYLAQYDEPQTPADLARHRAIQFRFAYSGRILDWPLKAPHEGAERTMARAMSANNMEALHAATRAGIGIACMPNFLVQPSLQSGALSLVLPDFVTGPRAFNMLWLANRHPMPKVRAFVEFISRKLAV
ncbi:LysR family transcriptional regulator [Methylovirgula sp. 4M-Z18]|uniref:LysR family transcriptional regulator n=1 Tax=Methylovirgula sp. 4M-Z18 TaxID=2293567 RepID=UPI000E2EFE1C|nr:LysR family transcriptional regulator [Methylovirgula sp. 4M-Z18]RFB80052.1 LysR family transcriptional regulator [Methylovirgula sp. 4M-Z18]